MPVTWEEWKSEFRLGKLILSYLLIMSTIISAIGVFLFGGDLLLRMMYLVIFGGSLGGLVDSTAHLLMLGIYQPKLDTATYRQYLHDFISGRTHTEYGLLAALFVAGITIMIGGGFAGIVGIILFGLLLEESFLVVRARYYH
ncbi:MAG: hypothetical protein QXL94_01115 [Candidatus Parvarchaeum sp.]